MDFTCSKLDNYSIAMNQSGSKRKKDWLNHVLDTFSREKKLTEVMNKKI